MKIFNKAVVRPQDILCAFIPDPKATFEKPSVTVIVVKEGVKQVLTGKYETYEDARKVLDLIHNKF